MSSSGGPDFPRAKPLKSAMISLQGFQNQPSSTTSLLTSATPSQNTNYLKKWEQERSRKSDLSFTIDYSQKVCYLNFIEKRHIGSFSSETKTGYFYFADIARVVMHAGGVLEFDLQGAGLRNVGLLTSGALDTCTLVKISYHTREKCGVHARFLARVLGSDVVMSQKEEDELVDDLVSLSISLPGVKKIPFSSLVFGQKRMIVGEGYFGYVVKAKYCGEDVAVKFLKEKRADGLDKKRFLREVSMLCNARHPHVVLCFGASVDSSEMCIVTEFVKHDEAGNCANLRTWASTAYLDVNTITRVSKDIAKTMLFLHEQSPSILHRDLRPSNVLINKHNQPILVDFGLSCIFDAVGKSKRRRHDDEDSFYEATAPEVIMGEPFSQKSDVWSFGLVLLELVLKRPPQHLKPELLKTLIPEHCNKIHKSIISSCLSIVPSERPSFGKIVDMLSLPEACSDVFNTLGSGSSSNVDAADQDMASPADPESQNMSPFYQPFVPSNGSRYNKLSDFNFFGPRLASASGSAVGIGDSVGLFGQKQGYQQPQMVQGSGGGGPQMQMQLQLQLQSQQQQININNCDSNNNGGGVEKMSEDNESQKDSNAMSTSTYSVVDMEIQSTEDVKIITYPIN